MAVFRAFALLLTLLAVAEAANASEPHPHTGIMSRFQMDGKPEVKLTLKDLQHIEAGRLWHRAIDVAGIGRGVGIRDVAAPLDTVWDEIFNLEAYVGKVPKLQSLDVYSRSMSGQEDVTKARYVLKAFPGFSLEYFVEHHADRTKAQLLFYLDYDRHSDINDLQGKWFLEPHPSKEGWTRIVYQCDIKLFGYTPALIKTLLAGQGIVSAVGWVSEASEKRAALAPPIPAATVPAFVSLPAGPAFGEMSSSIVDEELPAPDRLAVLQAASVFSGVSARSAPVTTPWLASLGAAAVAIGAASRLRFHRATPRAARRRRLPLHAFLVRL